MSAATVTVRELKNKDTGIDLSISGYKEVKGMIGSTYEYHIMVVTNLHYFKLPKHKESDNVQFMVAKKFADFEELWGKMNNKYTATAFPPLPKKVLMVNETVAKERWNGLGYYLKFLAMTSNLCTSSLLLTFLGVNPNKTGKLASMEVSESIVTKHESGDSTGGTATSEQTDITGELQEDETQGKKAKSTSNDNVHAQPLHPLYNSQPWEDKNLAVIERNLFDDGDDETDDFDLFTSETSDHVDPLDDTKLFDEPELGGAILEGEGTDLFVEDALPVRAGSPMAAVAMAATTESDDDSDDLFKIDDNLDKIMGLKLTPKVEIVEEKPTEDKSTENDEVTSPAKPKPAIRSKPNIPTKPKPPTKPDQSQTTSKNISMSLDNTPSETGQSRETASESAQSAGKQRPVPTPRSKPPIKSKPVISKKPEIRSKPIKPIKPVVDEPVDNITSIGQDDILKYIEDNAAEDDADLFS